MFFFSSRRRHTRCSRDWSSDVCSSDLFSDPDVGVVTALYKSVSVGTVTSNLDALAMYMDSAPAALVAKKIEGKMRFAFGWTMATSTKCLAEIGGWEAMVNYQSHAFELGKCGAERGHRAE